MSDNMDPPDGPCEDCGAIDIWACVCAADPHCECCGNPTDGSAYCEPCLMGDCPDCI